MPWYGQVPVPNEASTRGPAAQPAPSRAPASVEIAEDAQLEEEADEVAEIVFAALASAADEPLERERVDWQRVLPGFARRRRPRPNSENPFSNSGSVLPAHLRGPLEQTLDVSLGHVRLHADVESADLAERAQARAFTIGNHIGFGQHQWRAHERSSMSLLVHEVAHTLQPELIIHQPNFTPDAREPRAPQAPHGQIEAGGRPLPTALEASLSDDFDFDLAQVRIDDHDGARGCWGPCTRARPRSGPTSTSIATPSP